MGWLESPNSVIRGLNKSVLCNFIMGRLSLSENASSLKVQDELMDKLFFTQMGLSFGRVENPFDCFNCTYNGEICHSVSWNKTEHPYRGLPVHHLPMYHLNKASFVCPKLMRD